MQKIDGEVKIEASQIEEAIHNMAVEIGHRYRNGVTIIGVLKAAHLLVKDLSQALECEGVRHMTGYLGAQSFQGEDRTNKFLLYSVPSVHLTHKKPIILLDTICDSGKTLQNCGKFFMQRPWRPATIECSALVCALDPIPEWMQSAYVGFQVPADHKFLVGYGLDYNDKLRDLREIRELTEEDKVLKDEPKYATV